MNLALWAAKTGLDAQNTRMAVIANNLANTNTTGFKAGRAAFQDLMYQNIRQVGAQSTQNTQLSTGLTLGTGVRIVATEKDYTQGSVLQTNGALDMSVNGRGFLQITQPDGTIAYTRDGTFSLDNQGNVVTASFINVEGLQPTGNNLLVESAASGSPQVGTAGTNGLGTISQGALETSNVNSVTELVSMIECQRSYEMNSKAISTTDQMLQFLTTNLT
jgi:flagellar basal-body rod protein FlgG